MRKKKVALVEKTPKELKEIITELMAYVNCEGTDINGGCLGCGSYADNEQNVIVHHQECPWISLRDTIYETVGKD